MLPSKRWIRVWGYVSVIWQFWFSSQGYLFGWKSGTSWS